MSPEVLGELRILSSADFDAPSLLTVVLSGDGRLLELLRQDLEELVDLMLRLQCVRALARERRYADRIYPRSR